MKLLSFAGASLLLATAAPIASPALAAPNPGSPRYDDIMAAMCRSPATDQSCVLEGKRLTYWLGFGSKVDGRDLFTGVATAANVEDTGQDKLSLAQVTYEFADGRWKLLARQIDFGAVWANTSGNPAMDDDDGVYFSQPVQSGGVIIGYPTQTMVGEGIMLHGHTMFRSAPGKPGYWLHGGDIIDGWDNDTGCDREEAPDTCYHSSGTLSLTGKTVAQWPEIRATVKGSVGGDDGKARRARPTDGGVWYFSAKDGAYTTDTPH